MSWSMRSAGASAQPDEQRNQAKSLAKNQIQEGTSQGGERDASREKR